MAGHGHDHGHAGHQHGQGALAATRGRQRRVLAWVLVANLVALVVEVVGGIVTGSLALLADAAHLASDVGGLGIALGAALLLERPASARLSFGLQRAEVLAAQANGVLLVATAGWILVEAAQRIGDQPDIDGGAVLVIASFGLVVNLVSAAALARTRGSSLNLQGAYVHMAADAAGSVAAMAAGAAVLLADATWVDPLASVVIAVLVLWAAVGLLRSATHVLLEGVPAGFDVAAVTDAIATSPGVAEVHHVHVWALASDTPALSAHLLLEGGVDLHDAQSRGDEVKAMLAERFGIGHATLELECHACGPEGEDIATVVHGGRRRG